MTPIRNGLAHSNGDRPAIDRFEDIVANALMSRSELMKKFLDPRRDIDDECGFPRINSSIPVNTYQDLFDREPIANRVVEVLPKESWQVQPLVYEDQDTSTQTAFEKAWDELGSKLRPEKSWHKSEEGSNIWEVLQRADILSGIGRFGIILLGFNDGEPLNVPIEGVEDMISDEDVPHQQYELGTDEQYQNFGLHPATDKKKAKKKKTRELLYLRVFPESLVQITRYESNPASPRYCQPVMYSVTINDPKDQGSGIGLPTATMNVHWTRVIHIADSIKTSTWAATPRLHPVLNNLLSLRKLYGGSAEMYWRGAFPGYSIESDPKLGGDLQFDSNALKDAMENYMNGLQRYMALNGFTMKSLAPQVSDPTSQIAVQLEAICIQIACPVRVFKGSERGELASSQDDAAWNDRLRSRQANYITPRIIVPFVDRLIAVGVLPEPGDAGYTVEWPDLTSQTESEKATVASTKTSALATYVGGNLQSMVTPMDYLTRWLGFKEEDATAMLEAVTIEAALHPEQQMGMDPNAALGMDPNIGGDPSMDSGDPSGEMFQQLGALNWNPNQPRAADGKFGSGGTSKGSSSTPNGTKKDKAVKDSTKAGPTLEHANTASRMGAILKGMGSVVAKLPPISAKAAKIGGQVLYHGIKGAYERYGNQGSMWTYLAAHAAFVTAGVFTGGVSLAGAAAFGVATIEAKNLITGLVGALESNPLDRELAKDATLGGVRKKTNKVKERRAYGLGFLSNAAETSDTPDVTAVAEYALKFIHDFAEQTGTPIPPVGLKQVEAIIRMYADAEE